MSRVDQKLAFNKWCDHFQVDGERRDRLWRIMSELALTPDDINTYFLGASAVLEKVADIVKDASDTLPARVEKAARAAVGPVARAATAQVEAAHAKLAENTASAVAESVSTFFDERLRQRRFVIAAGWASAVVVLALVVLLVGYGLGRWNVAGIATEVAAYAGRGDWPAWADLMSGNSNLVQTLASYCGSGGGRSFVVQGVRGCSVPLWLDGHAPAAGGGAVENGYTALLGFLNSYHPLVLAGGGFFLGVLLRKLLALGKAVPGLKALAWIAK